VGACFALFTLAWGRKLAGLDLRAALLAVSAAACLQWAAFVPFSLTGVAGHLAAAALPLLSAAALVADRPAQAPEHPRAVAGGSPEASNTRHVLARLAAGAALVAFAIQLVWGFSIKMLPGHLDTGLFGALFVLVTVVIVAVALLCVLVMERQRSYRLELYYRTACGLCLLGAAAVGLAEISSSQAGIFSTYALTYVGHALIGLTVWLLVLGCVSMGAVPQSKAVGVVFGANYLGVFAGFVCVELLASGAGADGASGVPAAVVVFVAVGAIALVYLAVFPERTLLALAPQLFGLSPIGIEERCEKVAREAGLTPRETQVLALLARGRDVAYICDELSIARNTVNVHRKGIYSKLGIHSQQELLDLVERAGQE
jgi:DNA-binding CsgD family transcriptional regulator